MLTNQKKKKTQNKNEQSNNTIKYEVSVDWEQVL